MISLPSYALDIVNRLETFGFEAYVVGGCVRDSLMGRTPQDWDVCTNARPEEVLRVFRRFHVIKTGLQHGTVTVMNERRPVEITTFRLDGAYTDNRHPDSVAFVSRVEEDLSRRDFTINAMAYSPTRGLIDSFGGREDMRAGIVRCVGEPDARFNEDGLRILRALRFASRFRFDIARETAEAVRRNRLLLEHISAERVFKELKGILAGEGVLNMMLGFPEVLCTIIPELKDTVGFDQQTPYHRHDVWTHTAYAVQAIEPNDTLRLAMLLHDAAKPACFRFDPVKQRGHCYGHPEKGAELARLVLLRLKSDNATLNRVTTLVKEHDREWPTTRAGMRQLIGRLGKDAVQQLFLVKRADSAAKAAYGQEKKQAEDRAASLLFQEVTEEEALFTVKDLKINGSILMQLGMPPGPSIRRMLEALLEETQEERTKNTPEALLYRAKTLLNKREIDNG